MTEYGYFEITRSCGQCGRPMPVNGPVELVRCAACFAVNPVPLLTYHQIFEIAQTNQAALQGGATKTQTPLMSDGGFYRVTWGTHAPACRSCRTPLGDVPLDGGAFHCSSCGAATTTFRPPDWLQRLYPGAVQIYLGVQESTGGPPDAGPSVDQSAQRPIAMPCATCGAGLAITVDTPREHRCKFCENRLEIPEEVWDRLHPVESVKGWFVRFEGAPRPLHELAPETLRELSDRYKQRAQPVRRVDGRPDGTRAGPSRFACFKLSTACPSCKNTIPVNGPLQHPVCPTCGSVRDLPPQAIGDLLAWVAETEPSFRGAFIQYGYLTIEKTRVAPYCRRCETELVLVEPGTTATVKCSKCPATYASYPVPELFRPHAGDARQIYCGQRDSDPQVLPTSSAVSFACPSCGGDLAIDKETGRIDRCRYCSADVFIPDEVWHRFHPVTKLLPWFTDAGKVPESAEAARRARNVDAATKAARDDARGRLKFWLMFLGPALLIAAAVVYILIR